MQSDEFGSALPPKDFVEMYAEIQKTIDSIASPFLKHLGQLGRDFAPLEARIAEIQKTIDSIASPFLKHLEQVGRDFAALEARNLGGDQ